MSTAPGPRTGEPAAERILDAAERLFAGTDPAAVGMAEVARAAGCSRATLYRYFDSREALHTAYVHRWTHTLYRRLGAALAGVTEPRRRLVTGMVEAIALVRANPALASWFTRTAAPLGAELADRSEVITALVQGFLGTLDPVDPADPATLRARARWVVRTLTSLLVFPGEDAAAEAAMLTEFVAPVVLPAAHAAAGLTPSSTPGP